MENDTIIAYVMRDGQPIYRIEDFSNAKLDRRINSIDQLLLEVMPEYDVLPFDEINLIQHGVEMGTYIVITVEGSESESGDEVLRITANPGAGYVMDATGNPGPRYFNDVSLQQGFPLLVDLVERQHGANYHIEFHEVVPNTLVPPITVKPDSSPGQKQNVRRIETQTALGALRDLCTVANASWRCRPDLLAGDNHNIFVMEVGLFSEPKTARVVGAVDAVGLQTDSEVHYYSRATRMYSINDVVTDVFANGSNWMDENSKEQELALAATGIAPTGYVLNLMSFASGQSTVELRKLTDKYGVPFARRRYKRLQIPAIQAPNSAGFGLGNPDLTAYVQSLINACAGYLEIYSEPLETWSVTILGTLMDNLVFPGDRIYGVLSGRNCAYNGYMYLVSEVTTWGQGREIVSALELSNRLDSLGAPLDDNYKAVMGSNKIMQEVYLPPVP